MSVTTISAAGANAASAELARARAALAEAQDSPDHLIRYATAHVAALRVAAAVLAARAQPSRSRRRAQRNAWVLLAEVAPELAEWAGLFAAGAAKRAAAEAGLSRAVSEREADDLIREVEAFRELVESLLGLPHQLTLLYPRSRAS